MWTTGSRLFIGAAAVSLVGGLGIITQAEMIGTAVMLFTLAAMFLVAAGWCVATRDGASDATTETPHRFVATDDRTEPALGSIAPLLIAVAAVIGAVGLVFDSRALVLAVGVAGLAGADWIVTAYVDTLPDGAAVRRRVRRQMLAPAAVVPAGAGGLAVALPAVWSLVRRSTALGQLLIVAAVIVAAVTTAQDLRRRRHIGTASLRVVGALAPAIVFAHLIL